jgi:aldehyde dehydrogenase (NAD+)
MLVERGSYDEAVRIATETALDAGALVRPAHLPGDHYGPVSSGVQFERVQGYIRSGIDQEAKLVAGGLGRPEGTNTHGFFVKPTLFVDVMPNMTIAREEIFGPVLCMMPFDSEEEAVEIANGTPYGLTNYVHTKDRERRRRLARSLKSGMIEMNGIEADRGAPFAAMKASGNGREGGIWGLEEYTVIKVVSGVD